MVNITHVYISCFQTSANFEYVDVWSSQYSWGGAAPPVKGDMVVIPHEMTMLLDTDTPVLKLLLIQGKQVSIKVSVLLNSALAKFKFIIALIVQCMFFSLFSIVFSILCVGGKLIFEEKDIELKAENILITDGGLLQVMPCLYTFSIMFVLHFLSKFIPP